MKVAAAGRHLRALLEPWRGPAGVVALAIVAAQGLWRGWYIGRGYFTQDDFVVLAMAHRRSLPSLLFSDYSGHLMPARWLVAKLTLLGGPLPWWFAAMWMVLLMLAASGLMWLVLTRMLPDRWARVPILALFCFSPLTLWTEQQWVVASQFLPLTICLLGSVLAILRYVEDGWTPGRWIPVLLVAVALMFQERALLFPVACAGVALIAVRGAFQRRIVIALRSLWVTWAGLALVLVGYFVLHVLTAPIDPRPLNGEGGDLIDVLVNYVFRNALPGLLGGPWRPDVVGSVVQSPSWAVVLAAVAGVAVVVLTCRRGGPRAWWGWIMMAAYVLADIGILFGGRAQFGDVFALFSRYAADLTPVFAVALAAAVREHTPLAQVLRNPSFPRVDGRLPALVCAGVALVSAIPTTLAVAPALQNRDDRNYAENLQRQLQAAPDTVVYDATVPRDILVPWFGRWNRVSTVLATLDHQPRYDLPSSRLMIPDASGRLQRIAVRDPIGMSSSPQPGCGYPVSHRWMRVTLAGTVPIGRQLMRLDYFTSAASAVTVRLGKGADRPVARFTAERGLHSMFVPVEGGFGTLVVRNDDEHVVICLGKVAVGAPVPRS